MMASEFLHASAEDAHHVLADSSLTDERIRVLKHADTFALFDQYGDIRPSKAGEQGLYHHGTRFLSRLTLELEQAKPFLLSSTVRDDNDQLTVALTNPDLCRDGRVYLPMGSLHIAVKKFLWEGTLHQEIWFENYGSQYAEISLALLFAADFADIYEIRGMKRKRRGEDLRAETSDSDVTLRYLGLDRVLRETLLHFTPSPGRLSSRRADFEVGLRPRETASYRLAIVCRRNVEHMPILFFDQARDEASSDLDCRKADLCRIESVNGQFNALVKRAVSDVHMMTTVLPTGPYPYAGVPWFNSPFGRDGIITALECLAFEPGMARGVLAYLASTQATETIPEQDAEPGKILHETRSGEMAALGEMPFARYYGSVDATPLFVVLSAAYFERTGDKPFIEEIWRNIEAALVWMDRYGDRDGDGFLEYHRQSSSGLMHQSWKDSDDAIFHADGSIVEGPVAVCEVQGYAYAAWQAGSTLAAALGRLDQAQNFASRAVLLKNRFDQFFWCEELSTYGLALDADKRLCRIRTSNAGQCLFSGIATPDRAVRVARTLLGPESFSGWGVRTAASSEPRYNPMGYHTGSVWPHDNALIAYGLANYGLVEEAARIFQGMFEAGMYFDLHRIPELFCGFPRDPGEGPILYPVACAPQAWSAASVFLHLQASLGLRVSGVESKVSFVRPWLPSFLSETRILNLRVPNGKVDLLLTRHEEGVSVKVLHRQGDVEIMVLM